MDKNTMKIKTSIHTYLEELNNHLAFMGNASRYLILFWVNWQENKSALCVFFIKLDFRYNWHLVYKRTCCILRSQTNALHSSDDKVLIVLFSLIGSNFRFWIKKQNWSKFCLVSLILSSALFWFAFSKTR